MRQWQWSFWSGNGSGVGGGDGCVDGGDGCVGDDFCGWVCCVGGLGGRMAS